MRSELKEEDILFPSKEKGTKLPASIDYYPPEWRQAVAEETARLSKKFGRKVSPAVYIRTAVNQQRPEIAARERQIRKETKRNEKKPLDGIIRSSRIGKEVRGV